MVVGIKPIIEQRMACNSWCSRLQGELPPLEKGVSKWEKPWLLKSVPLFWPGPAHVPMMSPNGSMPPIFVPPGYVSQVRLFLLLLGCGFWGNFIYIFIIYWWFQVWKKLFFPLNLPTVSLDCELCLLCYWVMSDPISRIFLILHPAVKDTSRNKDSSEFTVWAPWTGSTCLFFISPVCRAKLGHVNSPKWLQVFYSNIKIYPKFKCPFFYQPWSPEIPAKQHCWSRVFRVWWWCKHWFQWRVWEMSREGSGLCQLCFSTPMDFPLVGVVRVRPVCCYQRYSQFPVWFISELMRFKRK